MKVSELYENYYKEDIDAMNKWADELYQESFAIHFRQQRDLYSRLQSVSRPITDEELETIMTTVPLELFEVSEKLSQFKIRLEVVKLKIKEKQAQIIEQSLETTITAKQQEAEAKTLEDKVVSILHQSIINRVTNEIDFSKELVMSAKKIYASRRATEEAAGITNAPQSDLPEYRPDFPNKQYVG